jgi:hypothetical protein
MLTGASQARFIPLCISGRSTVVVVAVLRGWSFHFERMF